MTSGACCGSYPSSLHPKAPSSSSPQFAHEIDALMATGNGAVNKHSVRAAVQLNSASRSRLQQHQRQWRARERVLWRDMTRDPVVSLALKTPSSHDSVHATDQLILTTSDFSTAAPIRLQRASVR